MVEGEPTSGGEGRCTWCGNPVERDDGWRLGEEPGARRATFCRLEHVVPWALQGAHWEAGEADEPAGERRATFCRLEHVVPWQIQGAFWEAGEAPELGDQPSRCSHCDAELDEISVLLMRHRGKHRIADGFCSVEHMAEWAKAGGRWR